MTLFTVTQFNTHNPATIVDQLQPVAPPFDVVRADSDFFARVRLLSLPGMGFFISRISGAEVLANSLRDTCSINIPLAAGLDWVAGRRGREVPVGDAWVVPEESELHLRFRNGAPLFVVNIDASLIRAYSDEVARSFRSCLQISLSTAAGANLFRLLTVHWSQALHSNQAVYSLAAIDEIQQSTVEALVATIWPEVSTSPASAEARRIFTRAQGHIRGALGGPLTVSSIAEDARTSPRTLHRVFLDYAGLSPMAYVRRERLNGVRRSLLDPDPGGMTTDEAAREHGFAHLERFSASYRAVFHELPSETLAN